MLPVVQVRILSKKIRNQFILTLILALQKVELVLHDRENHGAVTMQGWGCGITEAQCLMLTLYWIYELALCVPLGKIQVWYTAF